MCFHILQTSFFWGPARALKALRYHLEIYLGGLLKDLRDHLEEDLANLAPLGGELEAL